MTGKRTPNRTNAYLRVRKLLGSSLFLYYSDLEIVGRENIPVDGPLLIAVNHANSVSDAAVLLQLPCFPRLTMKDTLLKDPVFGPYIRSTNSIPIKRQMDYDLQVDNSNAWSAHDQALSNGDCVVWFIEGVGRYKPDLSPFRSGMAKRAVQFLLRQRHKSKSVFKHVYILPVGLTYTHRERYRSCYSLRIGHALRIDIPYIQNMGILTTKIDTDIINEPTADEIYQVSRQITDDIRLCFDDLVISASNWDQISIAHLAREIIFPCSSFPINPQDGTLFYFSQYIDIARQFNNVFNEYLPMSMKPTVALATNNEMKMNDNGDPIVIEAYQSLWQYWQLLFTHGIRDKVIADAMIECKKRTVEEYKRNMKCNLYFIHLPLFIISLCFTIPGALFMSPLALLWKYVEYGRIKRSILGSYDGLTSIKIISMFFSPFVLNVAYSALIAIKMRSKMKCLIFNAIYWPCIFFYVHGLHHTSSCLYRVKSIWKILYMSDDTYLQFTDLRRKCLELTLSVSDKYHISIEEVLSEEDRKHSTLTKKVQSVLYRMFAGPILCNWNDVIASYDMPADELHFIYEEQMRNELLAAAKKRK